MSFHVLHVPVFYTPMYLVAEGMFLHVCQSFSKSCSFFFFHLEFNFLKACQFITPFKCKPTLRYANLRHRRLHMPQHTCHPPRQSKMNNGQHMLVVLSFCHIFIFNKNLHYDYFLLWKLQVNSIKMLVFLTVDVNKCAKLVLCRFRLINLFVN